MIRVLVYLLILAVLAYGGVLLVQNPGHISVTWFGEVVEAPAALLIGAIALAAVILWSVARFVLGLPSFVAFAARQRRREKGYDALSRGLVAVGSGDGRTAGRAASQANRHLKNDPLAIMLRAQAAHLNGEGYVANAAFEELAQRDDTRVLGLRGLYAEAVRRGDEEAARHFAAAAHGAAALPWSAQAVLEHRASSGDWEEALKTVETSLAARLIDKEAGERQRAVLETAIAYDKEMVDPDASLVLARSAIKRARDLAPPVVLAARLLSRRGDIRKASKLIERAWPRCQHPDIAQAYLDVRPGDSTQDRLTRAQTLMGIATYDPVSRTTVARAAMACKDFDEARKAMAPLIAEGKRPSVRQCLLMAELEEAEHGDDGLWREWVARASRAPLDPAWICDGTVYDHWAPASPKTGQIDAFQWQVPAERLGPAMEAIPIPRRRPEESLPAQPKAAIAHQEREAESEPEPEPEPVAPAAPLPLDAVVRASLTAEPVTAAAVQAPVFVPPAPSSPPVQRSAETAKPVVPEPAAIPMPPQPAAETLVAARPAVESAPPADIAPTRVVRPTPPAASPAKKPPETPAPAAPSRQVPEAAPVQSAAVAAPSSPASAKAVVPEPPSVNPRISLPPDTVPEDRNPETPRALFHRRTQLEPTRTGNGAAPADDERPPPAPKRATGGSHGGVASETGQQVSVEDPTPALPNPRITLLPETVAEDRTSVGKRTLFHRRLTPESEARAEQVARAKGANGVSRGSASENQQRPSSRPNGGAAPSGNGATKSDLPN